MIDLKKSLDSAEKEIETRKQNEAKITRTSAEEKGQLEKRIETLQVCVCVCVCVRACMRVCMHVFVYISMCSWVYMCVWECVYLESLYCEVIFRADLLEITPIIKILTC